MGVLKRFRCPSCRSLSIYKRRLRETKPWYCRRCGEEFKTPVMSVISHAKEASPKEGKPAQIKG